MARLARKATQVGGSRNYYKTIRYLKRRYVEEAIRICNGNKSAACRILGISRNTLEYNLRSR